MKSYCEWFLSDGTVLYGKEAKAHFHSILSNYENLIDHIHFVLKDCLDHCRISRENTLPNTVMFTGESLNIIQIQLELLLPCLTWKPSPAERRINNGCIPNSLCLYPKRFCRSTI